jgi:RNA recognition motif-containing protein
MKVLVSNLNVHATEQDLEMLFADFGSLLSVKLIRGWDSYESRGLAVVEFACRHEGEQALNQLNKIDYMEQLMAVSEIRAPYSFSSQSLVTAY